MLWKEVGWNDKSKSRLRKEYRLMRLGKYLSGLTKPELEEIKELLNLTDDEEAVFQQLSKGRSKIMIADSCGISERTVSNRIKTICLKLVRLGVYE